MIAYIYLLKHVVHSINVSFTQCHFDFFLVYNIMCLLKNERIRMELEVIKMTRSDIFDWFRENGWP